MDMKKTKIVEWVMFVGLVLAVFVALTLGIALALTALMPVMGAFAALTLMFIVSVAAGGLWGYVSIMVWFWFAERGWFV